MRERLRDLVRERGRLRKHNILLINLLDHYSEMVHHVFSERRAEKLGRKFRIAKENKKPRIYIPYTETNQEFADRMKARGR